MLKNLTTITTFLLATLAGLFLGTSQVDAQSAALFEASDLISDDTPQAPAVAHSVSFRLPPDSQAIGPTDYTHIDLTNFSALNISGIFLGGSSTGTPTFILNGTTVRITNINLSPGKVIIIEGFTATNPISQTGANYTVSIWVSTDPAGTLIKNFTSVVATENIGTVQVSTNVDTPTGLLRISGFTGPQNFVIFSKSGAVAGTDVSSPLGDYSKLFTSLGPSTHSFALQGVDTQDRTTSIVPLEIFVPSLQITTISNILLSPTLEISKSTILQGEALYATGSARPGAQLTLFTDSPLRTYSASASASGDWTTTINNTNTYIPGDYRIYTLAQSGALQSLISPQQLFRVTTPGGGGGAPCGDISQGDLNCDSSTNLTDFSILMFYWGTDNASADINTDGIVDITDFSILMFYWG